jgi:hypothetical protein
MKETRRYYLQVGRELIQQSDEEIGLQKKGAVVSTSAPIVHHEVRLERERPDKTVESFIGRGSDWAKAEEDLDKQIPKVNP